MRPICKIIFLNCVLALTLSSVTQAEEIKTPPDITSPELARIKSLEGRWSATTSMFGKPNEVVYTEYEVTAGGSAVLERIFPGTPHEMMSVYYDDNGKLAMTHYCIMRNRPTLKLTKSDGDTIVMEVKKVDGLKSKGNPSMGDLTIRIKDENHMEQTCSGKGE